MNKYRDIESIINILASVRTLDNKDFTRYKELILKMCKYAEKYMKENSEQKGE